MIYLIAGISSFISGLGIGGGATFIILSLLFELLDINEARAYNLLMFISVGIVVFLKNFTKENVINKEYIKSLLWIILGCVIGFVLNKFIEESILKKIFYIFMLIIGIYEIFTSLKEIKVAKHSNKKGEN
ncbi:MAG: sulfite exporter TauE/SafE family protein [Clostridia bacterium]|nr:sulfite exporter TauE/SafE family protein [Clostridia bacterium]